ncbi:MAG: DEAD/DEAH box helicase, partial [Proteobacteria bacterium]|nr:DEAD/DEAH box helicase [Pseudomonadota bacterium]
MPEGAGSAAEFQSGAFVRSKKDASVSGIVTEAPPMTTGGDMLFVQVRLGTGELRYISVESLELVPAQAETADQLFAKGRFTDPDWLRRTLTRIRVTGGLADMFYSMEASDTDFYAHQFKPVLKLLNSPSESLLIADEVGLGKTIEAGLIWTELRARFDARRLLVVCPKTLCQKWRMELDRRFGVDAKIVNAAELLELMQERSATNQGFAAISWMQALRPPRDWEEADYGPGNEASRKPQAKLARYLRDAAAYAPLFDLLVIDEAHYMRNPETQTHKVGSALQPVSSHRVFLSATPIHLKNDDLHALLKLLDPDTFQRADAFHEILATNQPLIEARDRVMSSASKASEIRGLIDKAMAEPLLRGNNQLALIKEALGGRLDARRRSEIAWQLEQASLLANVVTRTRRRDVEAFKVVRDPAAPHLDMSEAERKFYDAATAEVSRHAMKMKVSDRFLLSVPQRLLSSSAAAASRYWAAASGDSFAELDEDEELATEPDQADDHRPLRDRLSDLARKLNLTSELEDNDTKYECLKAVLSGVKKSDGAAKLIVFSSFRITLDYLARRLKKDGVNAVLMHGSVKESRDELLRRFREESDIDLLLSSEVGSEGIDLQFCWAMVNYDLPWNPMRLEQRIGRIDRLGQKAKRIRITNLVHDGTIDNEIYRRLYLRLDLCRQALGEFEAVLGEPIRELTSILMDPNLTEGQKAQQLEQTAQALENQKLHHEKLEAEAGSLVAHGDVILQKIRDAHDMNRWLTDRDIFTFVSDALNRHYPGCTIRALHAS